VTVTVTHPPGTPSLSVPSGTNSTGSYTVSWSAVSTATSYTLQQQVNGGAWSSAYSGTATSKAFSGKANGTYGYRVQACNAGGCSAFSATGTVNVVHPPASAPSLSGPSSSASGTFTLSWTVVTGATSYHLHQIVNGSNTLFYASSSRSWSSSALGDGCYA
jgi:predicted phage tail protein